MEQGTIAYWLTWVGTGAWVVCFWWMHRISSRQDALLTALICSGSLSIRDSNARTGTAHRPRAF